MLATQLNAIIQPVLAGIAPAVSLAVYHKDSVILSRSWGVIDPENPTGAVNASTLFDLASLTKLYTTTALLKLLTAHNLSIHTPLVELIHEFGALNPRPIDGGQDPHSKEHLPVENHLDGQTIDPSQVTLRHLLTHTSGLPPWRDVYTVADAPTPPHRPDPISRDERWQRALERLWCYPFVDHIGANVRYSDVGLMLLGEVVARLHNSDLSRAIDELVCQPLSLENTLFNPVSEGGLDYTQIAPTELDPTWRKRRVWGEVHDENACGVGGIAGHAGLFATAEDVLHFGVAWLNNTVKLPESLYNEATREQVETDGERRGLGWMLPSAENSSAGNLMSMNAYGHTGFTGTSLWIDPERALVIALLTNRVYVGREVPGIHALRRAVADCIVEAIT